MWHRRSESSSRVSARAESPQQAPQGAKMSGGAAPWERGARRGGTVVPRQRHGGYTSHRKDLRNQNARHGLRATFLKWALKICRMTWLHFLNSSWERSGQKSPNKFMQRISQVTQNVFPGLIKRAQHDWHSCWCPNYLLHLLCVCVIRKPATRRHSCWW